MMGFAIEVRQCLNHIAPALPSELCVSVVYRQSTYLSGR